MWVPESKLGCSALVASVFPHWAILLAPHLFPNPKPERTSNSSYWLPHKHSSKWPKIISKVSGVALVWLLGFVMLEIKCWALYILARQALYHWAPHASALRFLTKYHLIRQTYCVSWNKRVKEKGQPDHRGFIETTRTAESEPSSITQSTTYTRAAATSAAKEAQPHRGVGCTAKGNPPLCLPVKLKGASGQMQPLLH